MSKSQDADQADSERSLRSTRRPRRRQRQTDEDEVIKASAPRRKRSKVSEDTFAPRASTEIADTPFDEGDNIIVNGNHHANGYPTSHPTESNLDIPVRSKKSITKRTSRFDGATILAQNQCYSVKLLPSTPKDLRKDGFEYRGSIGAGGYALAVTSSKAMIWDYSASTPTSNMRVFDVPFSSKAGEPLPFGALVPSDHNSDSGLLLVSATSGKVIFYESVDRAASLGLFDGHKSGVDGVLGSLFSGETVTDLILADHAGYIVVLSSGRLAQLTLRDAQGKARIASQFLRIAEPGAGGIFGSIKGLWNAGFRKDLSAVHTRHTSVRGQMQVISLTESAELLFWDLEWSGRSEYKNRVDCKDLIINELRSVFDAPELVSQAENIAALDFAIIDKSGFTHSQELTLTTSDQPLEVFVLVRAGTIDMHNYVIIELSITGENATVIRTSPLPEHHSQIDLRIARRPRLVLPKPGHTVYVVFEDAVFLHAAAGGFADTPEAQLRSSLMQAEPFSEAIHLRSRDNLAITSAWSEPARGSHASSVAFVKGFGLVRFTMNDVYGSQTDSRITIKSRIEQAIFYGILQPDNIVDFSRRHRVERILDEVEDAALAISDEILRADTKFPNVISSSPTSMEQHLAIKSRALAALVTYVTQNYAALPRRTVWKLLADAERAAAAQQLWVAFEEQVAATSQDKRKATLLDELCTWFETSDEFPHRKDLSNEDPVRRFFIGGLHRLDKLLLNVRVLLSGIRADSSKSPETVLRLVAQANDVWLQSLNTAFDFRTSTASSYGILPESIEDGILIDAAEYAEAPEFWTSTEKLVECTVNVASMSRDFANTLFEGPELTETSADLVRQISEWNPRLVALYCRQFKECIAWRASRPSEKDREHARRLEATFTTSRYEQLRRLVDVGQVNAGMKLAEKLGDMDTLVDIVLGEDQYLGDMSLEGMDVAAQVNELEDKIKQYFERYQDTWSTIFFDKLFSSGAEGKMLQRAQLNWKQALTRYLRANPKRAKMCWINDITEQSDFAHASDVLVRNAKSHEGHLWAKKVELSMSKLALLAAEEDAEQSNAANTISQPALKTSPQDELVLVQLQEKLYQHVRPLVIASIDREAALEQCMNSFGSRSAKFPALNRLLESGLDRVLDHQALSLEELIDIFTLLDGVHDDDAEGNLLGREFLFALQALAAAAPGLSPARVETLLKLIWKRCFTCDDWMRLGLSGKQSDDERMQVLRQSTPWNMYHLAAQTGIFADADSPIRPLTPGECLGASCEPSDLAHRFPAHGDLLTPILRDLRAEDELLQTLVAEMSLDALAAELARDARAVVIYEAEAQAKVLADERDFQEQYVEGGGEKSTFINGHGESNGHLSNGFKPGELMDHDDERSEMEMTD